MGDGPLTVVAIFVSFNNIPKNTKERRVNVEVIVAPYP
jgi:hypothetical protein